MVSEPRQRKSECYERPDVVGAEARKSSILPTRGRRKQQNVDSMMVGTEQDMGAKNNC